MFESYLDKRFAIMEQTENRPLTSIFRIILNHWPLLTRSARFVKPFINELEPNLILKGDSHHVCKMIKSSIGKKKKFNYLYLVLCLCL
jgi:hypothetical protein